MKNSMSHGIFRRWILCGSFFLVALILLGIFVVGKRSGEKDRICGTMIPIERVTAKYEKDGVFYLTVVLDDFFVTENHLSDQEVSMRTTESIYENIMLDKKYVGASLTVRLPAGEKLTTIDIRSVLKLYGGEYCEITLLTLADGKNTTIQ